MQGTPPPEQQMGQVWTQQPPNQIPLNSGMGMQGYFAPTQATLALVLSILGVVACSICTAIPGLILANQALTITSDQPGHPDAGLAKAAQVIGWIVIGLTILGVLVYGAMFAFLVANDPAMAP